MVDLILAVADGLVPVEQIDEESLAAGKHELQQRTVFRCEMVIDDMDHWALPVVIFLTKEAADVRQK